MRVRSVAILAGIWFAAGCGDSRAPAGDAGLTCVSPEVFTIRGKRKMDLLFVIDDSPAMANMEAKLAPQFPGFMSALIEPLSDLHVAVVSSSLGGGRFTDVPGCEAGGPGDHGGRFSHPPESGLPPGDTFMRFNGGPINFKDDAGVVFSRLAGLGHAGCPYPQPLEAARRALRKAQDPDDPDNAGFLRADAALAVVIITNEDDCSVPENSDLFDPTQTTPGDPYGAPGPYRCAERGWLCGGTAPPDEVPAGLERVALDACVPAEGDGKLTPVSEFHEFLEGLKTNPDDILVSVVTGPEQPVVIGQSIVNPGADLSGTVPTVEASCTGPSGETATPGVRLTALASDFGANGVVMPACASELARVLIGINQHIHIKAASWCLSGSPLTTSAGTPNCVATETHLDENGVESRWVLPWCDADRTVIPCWTLDPDPDARFCIQGERFRVCRDGSCSSTPAASGRADVEVQCQIRCP
jgi:hypothetical protein